MDRDLAKRNAALAALDYIKDGMHLGLGSGSTATHFVRLLGERVRQGLRVNGVPTSEATRKLATAEGVPVVELDAATRLDLVIDGADELDGQLRLIKGGNAALLREKIVASAADDYVVIVDEAKVVETLGAFPLPIEVTPFGAAFTTTRIIAALVKTGCTGHEASLRKAQGQLVRTDGGNYLVDARALQIPNPQALADALKHIPGVVEHGLFLGMAKTALIGNETGVVVRRV